MADQSYNYGYDSGGGSRRGGNRSNWGFWILALFFLFVLPPVGILMIVIKLAGGGKKKGRHPYYMQQEQGRMGARTAQMGGQPGPVSHSGTVPAPNSLLSKMSAKAKKLTIVGAVLSAVFGFASINSVFGNLWMLPDIAWYLEELVPIFCFFGAGLGCLWGGLRRQKRVRTFRSYLAMIGRRQTISISTLASATGASPAKVRDCLEDMLDDGLFPLGFLDYGGDRLVLSGEGLNDPAPAQEEKTEEKKAAPVDEENAVLAEIRAVNDSIEDAALSAQIDRIGVITAKIFEYQKSHPERSAQLHAFLSYYLPTTLKILRAYAQLESQGVEGENIAAAMSRIEGMMGKVVEGFEKQLDQLFQGDAMDITTDVAVLEQMLQKDGLSSSGGMQIGI